MITIKTEQEIKIMKAGGRILAQVLKEAGRLVRPGVTTKDLNDLAEKLILQAGGLPSFKGYKSGNEGIPFPTVLCASINEEVVHAPALPSRILKAGDIIGLDLGLKYPAGDPGLYTDMAITKPVGKISSQAKKLLKVTQRALELAIKKAKVGNELSDISRAIQDYVERQGFSVVRELVGHGVGRAVHEPPRIPNFFSTSQPKIELKEGMTLALEPMVNLGGPKVNFLKDGWTVVTADGKLSAHFEHTIVITKKGPEIITV